MTHYLCMRINGMTTPIMGPMRSDEVVAIIVAQGDNQVKYSNASRYDLTKRGYPRNKQGDLGIELCLTQAELERRQLKLDEPIPIHGALGAINKYKKFLPTQTGI